MSAEIYHTKVYQVIIKSNQITVEEYCMRDIMKKAEKRVMIFISCTIIFLILMQHHYVDMYFDDYGYASLSYAGYKNHAGMSYGLVDIFQFLKAHYFNWGGRILYFFFEILIFRLGGLPLMQVIQAAIIILIGVVSGRIVSLVTKANPYKCVALAMVLYGTIHIKTLRDGVYWYSASVLYVWPLLPLFGSIYLYLHNETKVSGVKKAACILLTFFAAFSQEQIAVLDIVIYICIIFFRRMEKDGKIPKYLYGVSISAFSGGILTIFAPGNAVRAGSEMYDEFYSKGILFRTVNNIGYIINDNVGLYNCVFVFFLTIFCGTAAALYMKNRVMAVTTTVFAVLLLTGMFIPVPKEIGVIIGGLWLAIFIPALALYYFKRKYYLFLSLLIAGICTQIMMIVSPAIPLRLHTMFEFILHILMAECIVYLYRKSRKTKKGKVALRVGMIVLTLYSICNMAYVITGYKNNYEINQRNSHELIQAAKACEDGQTVEEVVLYKLKNDTFAQMMPYQEGYHYIEVWMKNYYELPADTKFEWK